MDINTAKALLATIKHNNGNINLECVQASTVDGTRRYVATNGHTLLCIERPATQDEIVNDEGPEAHSLSELKEYVATKGYSILTDSSADYGDFPDWQQCVPTTTSPTETIGLSVKYLKMLADIGRFLKVGDTWKASFAGPLSPTTWEAVAPEEYTRVLFVIMPIRLD